jgi:hypothetical protein
LPGVVRRTALWSEGPSSADPPRMLTPDAPPHRHFIVSPNGNEVMVGRPNICEHPELQQAFNEFHYNIHHSFGLPTQKSRHSARRPKRQFCTTVVVPI